MNIIDLFSGIGGFSLAGHWAGHKTVLFCEKDETCRRVLKYYYPGVPIYTDIFNLIKEFNETKIKYDPDELILTGGFPCQPFSQAGKRLGTEDDRYLWDEMYKIILHFKPKWVIAENVRGLLSIEGGMVFNKVIIDLENAGYEVQAFSIPAVGKDAPHKRDRIWIIANRSSKGRPKNSKRDKTGRKDKGEHECIYVSGDAPNCNATQRESKIGGVRRRSVKCCSKKTFKDTECCRCVHGEDDKERTGIREFGDISTGSTDGVCISKRDTTDTKNIGCRGRNCKKCKGKRRDVLQGKQEGGTLGGEVKRCCGKRDASDTNITGLQGSEFGNTYEREEETTHGSTSKLCEVQITADSKSKQSRCKSEQSNISGQGQGEPGGSYSETITDTDNGRLQVGDAKSEWEGTCETTERYNSIPDWRSFPVESPVCDRNDGLPDRLVGITFSKWRIECLKMMGNSIVPQVALELFKAINAVEQDPDTVMNDIYKILQNN